MIAVVNPTGRKANLQLSLFNADGQLQKVQPVTLAEGQRVSGSVDELFGLNSNTTFTGWLRVDSDVDGIVGAAVFRGSDPDYQAALPLQDAPATELVFPHVAQLAGFFTGIAVLNPTAAPTQVDLQVFDEKGGLTGQGTIDLEPGAREAKLVNEFIGGLEQAGGYIRLSASDAVFAYALFGTNSLSCLAAIPGMH